MVTPVMWPSLKQLCLLSPQIYLNSIIVRMHQKENKAEPLYKMSRCLNNKQYLHWIIYSYANRIQDGDVKKQCALENILVKFTYLLFIFSRTLAREGCLSLYFIWPYFRKVKFSWLRESVQWWIRILSIQVPGSMLWRQMFLVWSPTWALAKFHQIAWSTWINILMLFDSKNSQFWD